MPHVWYVSYGSNMVASRLACYLAGGRPPGGRRATPGARDPSPPTGERRVDLAHPLMFGGPSLTWNGGPAYLDVDRPGHAVGRAWRITHEQFEDVLAQENGLAPGAVTLSRDVIVSGGQVLDKGYGRVVALPPLAGEAAATFTYVVRPADRAPDPAYLALIREARAGMAGVADRLRRR